MTQRRSPRGPRTRNAVDLIVDVLRTGGSQRIVARGGSMEPAIRNGAVVELVPLAGPPRLGDVLVVRTDLASSMHGLLIHRVIGVRMDGAVLLRGDAVTDADGWIAPRDILGRALVDGLPPPPLAPRVHRSLWSRVVGRLRALL